jgi:hypothetical protein
MRLFLTTSNKDGLIALSFLGLIIFLMVLNKVYGV